MFETSSRRFEKIINSTEESVSERIGELATTWRPEKAYTIEQNNDEGAEVLQFKLIDKTGEMASTEDLEAFLNVLRLTDDIVDEENSEVVSDADGTNYIAIEPRKNLK